MDPMLKGAEALAILQEIARTPNHSRHIVGERAADIVTMVELYRMAAMQAPLKVERGGNITGKLPCGHDVSNILAVAGEAPYCKKCWNA